MSDVPPSAPTRRPASSSTEPPEAELDASMSTEAGHASSRGRRLVPELLEPVRNALVASPAVLPGLVAYCLFIGWFAKSGAFPATVWYPGALLVLAALAVTVVARAPRLSDVPRSSLVAIAALGLFTAWCFISIAWADVRGDAWDGANRTLFYLAVFVLFALWPMASGSAAFLLGAFTLAAAALLGFELVGVLGSEGLVGFQSARFDAPTQYAPATAAFALIAIWPGLFLASRRETPWAVRGALAAAVCFLVQVAILAQSRTTLLAFPIVLILYFAFVPGRARSLATALLIAASVALTTPTLLDVYDTYANFGTDGEIRDAIHDAARLIAISCVSLLVVGTALALLDRRLDVSAATRRLLGRIALAGAAIGMVVFLATAVVVTGNPIDRISDGWREFTSAEEPGDDSSRFASGFGGPRYDMWRVSVDEFLASPLTGIGADNFAVSYLEHRRLVEEEPLYPHSIVLRVPLQTGVVGAILFACFLAAAGAAVWRALRRASPFGAGLAGAAAASFVYFFCHGVFDWFWEFPGVGGPAFAALGLAAGLSYGACGRASQTTTVPSVPRARGGRVLASLAVLFAVGLFAAASLIMPWLAARERDTASRTWGADPAVAYDRLERARALNFLSDRPDLVQGTIASRLRDWERARLAFSHALERNPSSFYASLQLGVADAMLGDRAGAIEALERSRDLSPLDPLPADLLELLRSGEAISPEEIEEIFLERANLAGSTAG